MSIRNLNYKSFKFPSGEPHLKLEHDLISWSWKLIADLRDFNDVGELFFLKDMFNPAFKYLYIPFFPCARQDRTTSYLEPLSLKVFADLINNLNFDYVHLYDVHSDVCSALVNNCVLHTPDEWLDKILEISKPDCIIIPDAGATKRIEKLGIDLPHIQCGKVRDTKTGQLGGFRVYDDIPKGCKNALMIDDIAQNAGTQIGLGKLIKKMRPDLNLDLYVTHGFFGAGIDIMSDFRNIIKTDTILVPEIDTHKKVKIIKLFD